MEESGEREKNTCSTKCFSLNRCECAFLTLFILALLAAIGTLGGFLAKEMEKNNETIPPLNMTTTTTVPPMTTTTTTTVPTQSEPWKDHRLPNYIFPVHYDLTLFPDFYDGRDDFYGNVTISLNVTMATQYLLIHIRDLTITNTRLMRSGNSVSLGEVFHYEENEYWVVAAQNVITPGMVQVALQFQGSLVNGIVGLYKSVYVDSRNNETKYLATSKFQPTDARKAFPCLDEPGFKSTYNTTLIHRQGLKPLSNMPKESASERPDGLVATKFQKSVPMVTYLACFIVCEFDYKESTTTSGTPFRVYAPPDKIDQVDYSLDIGVKILQFFEEYYGLAYPLPKMDMIAIPDFVSGAMEHWGLITYRETNLLYDTMQSSLAEKERVAVVVSHELAHMWFGNLVTMVWWDDLWLNEGFASYVEYLGVDFVHPDWDMNHVIVTSDVQRVMPDDSRISSHPIIVPVNHPSEITEVFDSISYSKGASVLRMLESFMGEEKFKQGLRAYMQKYQLKNTVTADLWRSLEEVDEAPAVSDIMDTWTRQMGYPVVTVEIQGSKVKLTQERFLLDPNADKTQPPSDYGYLWHIPIRYQTQPQGESSLFWMDKKEFTFTPPVNPSTNWIKINVREEGFYRVNYPSVMWSKFAELLQNNHQVLSPSDRSNLIDDIFNLASAGLADLGQALDLIRYMGQEQHLVPWRSVSNRLDYISEMMVTTIYYEQWQVFIRSIAAPILRNIGYEDQDTGSHLSRQLRSLVIGLACGHGDEDCQGNMTLMFRNKLQEGYVSPNIRSRVYRYGMASIGDEEVWNKMWNEYNRAVVPQEKRRLLYAVTQTTEPWLIQRLLEFSRDKSKVRDQDFFTMIAYLGWNQVAHPFVWNFAKSNWEELVERFDINNRYLGRMIPGLVNYFNSEARLQEVEDFFAKYPEAGAGARAREQALEQIQTNIAWMNTNLNTIVTWLQNNIP